jgi:aminopeptidase N
LLTFDMGVFSHVDGHAGATPIRVFVRPGKEAQAAVMLADAERLLPFYERFFATRYPLPKLDIVVANTGFETALEGWGAITAYSEEPAFGHQMNGGKAGRLLAVQIVAHEVAHQWVGDFVSMRRWRDTFVGQGLAEFAQWRAIAELYPELDSWTRDDFDVESVLRNGVAAHTRAVVSNIASDLGDDDDAMFGGAVYEKGAAVVRQWQLGIGDAAFTQGISAYMQTHALASATVEDFWSAFTNSESSFYGKAWLTRPGFPLVDLDATCAREHTTISIDQRAYVTDAHIGASYRQQLWPIPLQVDIAGVVFTRLAPAQPHAEFTLPGCGIASIDAGFRPYARTKYAGDAAAALGVRPVRERTRLFYDYAAMHGDGYLTSRDYLAAVASPRAFDGLDLSVAGITATQLDDIRAALDGSLDAKIVTSIERSVLAPALAAQPLSERFSPFDRQGVRRSLSALAAAGDTTFAAESRALFFRYAGADWPNSIGGIQSSVAAAAGVDASREDVDRVEALLRDGKIEGTGQSFLENVRDESLLTAILSDSRTDSRIAGGSFTDFFFATGSIHPRFAYAYVRTHLHGIRATVVPTQQAYAICGGIAANLWSAAPPAELERLMKTAFPKDRVITERAAARIRASWARRTALEAELAN